MFVYAHCICRKKTICHDIINPLYLEKMYTIFFNPQQIALRTRIFELFNSRFLYSLCPFLRKKNNSFQLSSTGFNFKNPFLNPTLAYLKGIVKWKIFFFVKSWAIVPRGTIKKKIWLGTFFGSVLTISISFSGSVIVFSGLVIDTPDSYTYVTAVP